MNSLNHIPFKMEHMDDIRPKAIYAGDEGLRSRFALLENDKNSFVYTVLGPSGPIAVAGIVVLFPGNAEVFSITSDKVKETPVLFHKTILHLLKTHQEALTLHRITMTVLERYEEGHKWAESLGFQREGLMRKYGPDQSNHYLYSRIT